MVKKIMMGTVVPEPVYDQVANAVKSGKYMSESEFIRISIIEKLEKEGYVIVNEN